jgi:hypothetical protein
MINAAPNEVDALGFDLTFDPSVLQYTGAFTRGALVAAWSFFDVSNPTPGKLKVGGFTVVDPIQAGVSGTLVRLEFLVVCNNCGAGSISELVATNLVDDVATWSTCPGSFHFIFCVDGQGLDVGDSRASGGGVVSIPVLMQGALNDVDALGFDVFYNPNVLQFTGMFTRGPLVANWSFVDVSEISPGRVRVGGFTVIDTILAGEDGTVVTLEFNVVCSNCAVGDTSEIFVMMLVDDLAGWPACPGTFTFGCPHCGDVDLSQQITPTDALLAFRHYLQFLVLEGCALEQADVNGNGEVTSADALEIFKEFLQKPNSIDPACWP